MRLAFIVLSSIFLFSQCKQKNDPAPNLDLNGSTWVLKSGSGSASITGDLDGDGRADDGEYPYDDFVMFEIGSEVKFESAGIVVLSNSENDFNEPFNYTINNDEIKIYREGWQDYYFNISISENEMTLKWDREKFNETFSSPGLIVHTSNIVYQLSRK